MLFLKDILLENENWLMNRIVNYAKKQGYSTYSSTLNEAWRLSISGLTASILECLNTSFSVPELTPDMDIGQDTFTQFGITEAQRHRERGVELSMFLGLMKYYRQSYIDLIKKQNIDNDLKEKYRLYVNKVFDRIEIGFCVEWISLNGNNKIHELQMNNLFMTNEKNKYLTIFESIPNPVIILNKSRKIDSMNLAAVTLYEKEAIPGSQYYCPSRDRQFETEQGLEPNQYSIYLSSYNESPIDKNLVWIEKEINDFYDNNYSSVNFEKAFHAKDEREIYQVRLAKLLDISGKFEGVVIILENITALKMALEEVRTLRGIVPICSNCKKIRDDSGYWQQVEQYVQANSEAQFSHSICPDCAEKLYPEYYKKVKK